MNATTTTSTMLAHGWVDSPDGRGTIDIIWSCVVTVFLCSWSVLFLNVPRRPGRKYFLGRKMLWVVFTIFAPEGVAAFAQQQWISASQSVSDFSKILDRSDNTARWSLRHAFFADMGGFMLESPDYIPFPVDAHQLYYLVTNNFIEPPEVDKEAIWDKNKADGLSRLLTLIQVSWFAIQCLGRAIQHLPLSTCELSTLAFIFCTLPTFLWWRHKPLDVATTIAVRLKPEVQLKDVLLHLHQHRHPHKNQRRATDKLPFRTTPLEFLNPRRDRFDLTGPLMWGLDLVFGIGGAPEHGPIASFPNSNRNPPRGVPLSQVFLICTISAIYICLHLVGWNFVFPTVIEQKLWRAATLAFLGCLATYGILYVIIHWQLPAACRLFGASNPEEVDTVLELLFRLPLWFQYFIAVSWLGLYGLARLFILVEAFISLRALPTATYETVNWSNFLPHI